MKKTNNLKQNVYYVWFHHMALTHEQRDYIHQVIENHDYEEFMRLSAVLNEDVGDECIFLPEYAFVEDENADEPEMIDITEKANFFRIRMNECECG